MWPLVGVANGADWWVWPMVLISGCVSSLARDDANATAELNQLLYSSINDRLKANHVDPNLVRMCTCVQDNFRCEW